MQIYYNKNLTSLAKRLRKNSTKSEVKLWGCLRSKQMMGYDFHRQKPIDNFIADFFCNELGLVIELDGYTHSFEHIYKKDMTKERILNNLGIRVLRFNDEDVMNNIDDVLMAIWGYIVEFEKSEGFKNTPPTPLNRGEKKG